MFPCVLVFTEELVVFLRENHARIYRTSSYFISKNLAELPQFSLLAFLYGTIIYFATTNVSNYHFLEYLQSVLICSVSTFMAVSIGYAAATVVGPLK